MVKLLIIRLLFLGLPAASLSLFAVAEEVLPENVRAGNSPVILVDQADEQKKTQGVTIEYTLSTHTVVTRQMLMIQYRLLSNDAFITLRTDIEPENGESYVTLLTRKTTLPQGSEKRYQYELNVLFSASHSGVTSLRIPALIYSEGGKDRYRFQFKEQEITIASLPSYLPPYTPISPLVIDSSFSQDWSWFNPLNTNKVYYWTINLQAETADQYSLPDIRQQLVSDDTIQFLPAEVSRDTIKQHDKLIQKTRYTIPFVINSSAVISLPELSLRYFDPESKRLSSTAYRTQDMVALNQYLHWVILILAAFGCVFIVWKVRSVVAAIFVSGRDFYRARRLVLQAQSALQLRCALKALGLSWGWPGNLSLQQWARLWQRDIDQAADMRQATDRLAYCLYGCGEDPEGLQYLRSILASSYIRQWILCFRTGLKSSVHSRE